MLSCQGLALAIMKGATDQSMGCIVMTQLVSISLSGTPLCEPGSNMQVIIILFFALKLLTMASVQLT